MRDLLALSDWSKDQLTSLIDRTQQPVATADVSGRRVALLWDGLALRHRAAIDIAAAELGLVCVEAKSQIGGRETIRDLAGYLDNWFDLLVVRGGRMEQLQELAERSRAGVLNAGGKDNHPTEVLSDVAYLYGELGDVEGLTIGFVGPATNVLASWLEIGTRIDIRIVQISPAEFRATPRAGASFVWTRELNALAHVDVVYTDCWWPVRLAGPEEKPHLRAALDPYRVTRELLALAPPDAMFLHGPPLTEGLEIDADVIESSRYSAYTAKRWLLPTLSAVITELLVS